MSFPPPIPAIEATDSNTPSSPQQGQNGGPGGKSRKIQTRRKFTSDEDETIRALVAAHGEYNWELVATFIPGRTPRQCRDRYRNNLKPGFICSQWTREEDETLYIKHTEHGSKWTLISQFFPGRSPATIKNRWNYYVSKMHFFGTNTAENVAGYSCPQYSSESEDLTAISSSSTEDTGRNDFPVSKPKPPTLQTDESLSIVLTRQIQPPQQQIQQLQQLQQQRQIIEIENRVIDNTVIDNTIIDNRVIENKVIENKVIENKVIENRNKLVDGNLEDIDSLFSDKDIEFMFENDFDLISSI